MKLPQMLRLHKQAIRSTGLAVIIRPEHTFFVSPYCRRLSRQSKALELVRHLGIAPHFKAEFQLRGLNVLETRHPRLQAIDNALARGRRSEKIYQIRRLGAAIGMVHSIKHSQGGFLDNGKTWTIARLLGQWLGLSRLRGAAPLELTSLRLQIRELWPRQGGTLVLNFRHWPLVRSTEDGMIVLDYSQAMIFEPLWDLFNFEPTYLGMEDTLFFWEYFLQGYCATAELDAGWKLKLDVLSAIVAPKETKQWWQVL